MTAAASSSASGEVWTIARVLRWATDDLTRRGINDSPRLDVELLLGHATGLDRVRLIVDSARPLAPHELDRFKELLVRRRWLRTDRLHPGRARILRAAFQRESARVDPRGPTRRRSLTSRA